MIEINKKPCSECPYVNLHKVPYESLDPRSQDMYWLTLTELTLKWECGHCHTSNEDRICYGHWMDRKSRGLVEHDT